MKIVLAFVSSLMFASVGLSASFPGIGGGPGLPIGGRPPIPGGGVTDPAPGGIGPGGFGPGGTGPIQPIGGVTDPSGQLGFKISIPLPTKVCTTVTKTVCEGSGKDKKCHSETIEKCIEIKGMSTDFTIPSDAVQVKVFDGISNWKIYDNRGNLQRIQPGNRNLFN